MPSRDSGEPCVEFAHVPPYRSFDLLAGDVQNVPDLTAYKVCPFIRVRRQVVDEADLRDALRRHRSC